MIDKIQRQLPIANRCNLGATPAAIDIAVVSGIHENMLIQGTIDQVGTGSSPIALAPSVQFVLQVLEVLEVLDLAKAGDEFGRVLDLNDLDHAVMVAGGLVARVLELGGLHFSTFHGWILQTKWKFCLSILIRAQQQIQKYVNYKRVRTCYVCS